MSLVVEVRPAGATPRDKDPTVKRLRMLAVFSLPTGAGALNLRHERYTLRETIRSIARTARRAIHLRVLQYGVTREALKTILEEGEGGTWSTFPATGWRRSSCWKSPTGPRTRSMCPP